MERYLEAEYCKCSSALEVCLLQLKNQTNPPEVKSKSKSVHSSMQSKLMELKRDLMPKQDQERAQYEFEMEQQKLNWNLKIKSRRVR